MLNDMENVRTDLIKKEAFLKQIDITQCIFLLNIKNIYIFSVFTT